MDLKRRARHFGATEFGKSYVKGKRFYVKYQSKIIHFGSDKGFTYYDHGDKKKRAAWHARHSKIKDQYRNYVINDKSSPSFWSANLLW